MNISYRPATADDSRFIAGMIDIASDGIATLEWEQQRDTVSGQSALDVGSENYAGGEGDYSYRNCLIAEADRPVGMILSFPITAENCSKDAAPPPYEPDDIYAPYKYLEAIDSWYICGVAVIPEYRKQGIGAHLMKMAMRQGEQQGYANCSLIAIHGKTGLIRYYESMGFCITRRAPIVDHPGIRVTGEAVLMETRPRDLD